MKVTDGEGDFATILGDLVNVGVEHKKLEGDENGSGDVLPGNLCSFNNRSPPFCVDLPCTLPMLLSGPETGGSKTCL